MAALTDREDLSPELLERPLEERSRSSEKCVYRASVKLRDVALEEAIPPDGRNGPYLGPIYLYHQLVVLSKA